MNKTLIKPETPMLGLRLRARDGGPVLHLHAIDEYRHVSCTWMDAMGQVQQGNFLLDDLVVLDSNELLPPPEHCADQDAGPSAGEAWRLKAAADRVPSGMSQVLHRSLARLAAFLRPATA